MVHNILSVALAEHFDSLLLGREARARLPFCAVEIEASTTRLERPDVAESLLLVSRQFYQITLHVLSAALSIPFRESSPDTRASLEENPWIELSWIRKLRSLVYSASASMEMSRIWKLGTTLPLSRCAFGRAYRAVLHLKHRKRFNRVHLRLFSDIEELQELQSRHPMSVPAPDAPDDVLQLPDAFRSVLLKQVDQARVEEVIFYKYDVYATELILQWTQCVDAVAVGRCDDLDALIWPNANRIHELVEHIRDSDSDMRRTWAYSVPLDRALGTEKLTDWCTLLRRIVEANGTSQFVSIAKDASQALLQEFEPRLERLRQEEGTMAE
ncbi:hypothetical protein PsYK624_011330 [Phanerochaete sordida]|uniref:Uncharacterized protein n=1 Tax=Phanerochaete sordida TaxID=48140 RepID=A0A9P3FYQ8_9APHY|nr:hypothetical protein PsYK624_011330 [Phanerochaete sordida]